MVKNYSIIIFALVLMVLVLPKTKAGIDPNTIKGCFTNLDGVRYYSGEIPFCDAFKTANRWEKTPAGNGGMNESYLDANGWIINFPTGITAAESYLFLGNGGKYPLGQYILTWEGGLA